MRKKVRWRREERGKVVSGGRREERGRGRGKEGEGNERKKGAEGGEVIRKE